MAVFSPSAAPLFHTPPTGTRSRDFTRCISLDGRKYEIACGQIDTGNAETEMTDLITARVPQANGLNMVEPRMNVRHVADAMVCMASR
jgi:hypothetical protein